MSLLFLFIRVLPMISIAEMRALAPVAGEGEPPGAAAPGAATEGAP
jgi:hypothetical protein